MGQMGFFDLSRRYEGLDAKNDPLVALERLVPWEAFRPKLEAALAGYGLRRAAAERKSAAGRKPWDAVVVFKALVVQALYNLSDEQTEYQLRDRLSFMRFLGFGIEDRVPELASLAADTFTCASRRCRAAAGTGWSGRPTARPGPAAAGRQHPRAR